ncbi:hypothetical protein BDR26DRAFT_919222 [Obelidium mucronatum]|nr:hypothetical protein BDR26DRAFT_919222 [Obelidium mucronatum]
MSVAAGQEPDAFDLVSEIVKLRIADDSLTIKQVYAALIGQGREYSETKVKKSFRLASRVLKPSEDVGVQEKQKEVQKKSAADGITKHTRTDVTSMFKAALKLLDNTDECLSLAAQSFLTESQLPSANQDDVEVIRNLADKVTDTEDSPPNTLVNGWVVLAGIHLFHQDYPQAISALHDAFRILKSMPLPLDKLKLAAISYLKSSVFAAWGHDVRQVIDALDQSLELDPACARSRASRCILRHRMNLVDELLDDVQSLLHYNPEGSFHHAESFYLAALNLFAENMIDAGKFWLDFGDRFLFLYPTEKTERNNEAHKMYAKVSKNAPPKQFDFPLRSPDVSQIAPTGALGQLDALGDMVYQKMLEDSFMSRPKTKKSINMKKSLVDSSEIYRSVPLLPEDGDQSGLKGEGAQVLREAWAEGMDFEPIYGMPLLHKKCFLGDIKWLKENQEWRMLEFRVSGMRFSPLMCIVQGARQLTRFESFMNHKAAASFLLEKGAQINARCVIGNTALFYATGYGCNKRTLEIAKVLLDGGAAVNIQNRFGCTAILAPIMAGSQESVKLLAEYGCDARIPDYERTIPLGIAKSRPTIFKIISDAVSLRTEASTEKANCLLCGFSGSSLKYCPNCLVAGYCSAPCQRADWKNHKRCCKTDDVIVVTLSDQLSAGVCKIQPLDQAKAEKLMEEGGKLRSIRTVKIQAGRNMGQHLVYDKERSFIKTILPEEKNHARIAALIEAEGVLGEKGYFHAQVDGSSLRLLVSKLLPPCNW